MTGEMKLYLLAELSGWNCTSYAYSYYDYLKNNKAYQILESNINEVKKHISRKAEAIVDAYNEITFQPSNVKECFLIENAINYVALHSFEEYYVNPLTINPNYKGRLLTIGELIFDFKGEERPLNDIILDESYSDELKKEAVYLQLEQYLDDANDLVYSSLENVKNEATYKIKTSVYKVAFECLLIIIFNVLYAFMLCYPYKDFQYFFTAFESNKVTSYVVLLFSFFLFAYDLIFTIFHSYKAMILEPYNYAKRFLNKHASKVFDDLYDTKEKLYNYISGAIKEKIVLTNDIKDFSKLSSSYIDFEAVLNASKLKGKKTYKVLRTADLSFLTLTSIIALLSFIIYLVNLIFKSIV